MDSNAMLNSLSQLLTVAISAVLFGGFFAVLLDDVPWWSNWKPMSEAGKKFKLLLVVLLNCAVGVLLYWTRDFLLPTYYVGLSPAAQVAIWVAATYLMSQLTHTVDKTLTTLRTSAEMKMRLSGAPERSGSTAGEVV